MIDNQQGICKEIRKFYNNLYTTENIEDRKIDRYLESIEIKDKLSDGDKQLCEGMLSLEECEISVFKMKKDKSPGYDGLTVEFYQKFWKHIGNHVVNAWNEGYVNGELSDTQKHGVVSLIYKKDDPQKLRNWRPISLLNIDYKIAAYSLACRLKEVMPNIINTNKNGYIKTDL